MTLVNNSENDLGGHRPKVLELLQLLHDDGMSYGDYPSANLRVGVEQFAYLVFLNVSDVERRPSVIEGFEGTVETNLTHASRLRESILRDAFSAKLTMRISHIESVNGIVVVPQAKDISMWDWLNFGGKQSISSFDHGLTRERLIQAGRIVVIDDETPLLIEEMRKEGFAVDHDTTGEDLRNLENQIYDVAIIDYHGVGQRLGTMQGLDLVKHLRRVTPRTRLVAYTSRSLSASESDFFRLSHAVLPKDLGLGDSLALMETELRKAFSKEHLFEALLAKLNVTNPSEKERIEKALTKALAEGKDSKFREALTKIAGQTAEKAVEIIIAKLFFS